MSLKTEWPSLIAAVVMAAAMTTVSMLLGACLMPSPAPCIYCQLRRDHDLEVLMRRYHYEPQRAVIAPDPIVAPAGESLGSAISE